MMQGFVKEKEFYKQAACIAIPISLQSVITIGVSMMDNIMVGALGETALSAVALANQFIGIYQIGCMGIGMGASVLTARFWGMKDITSLKKVVTIMFRNCIGLALLVFMAPTLLIPDRLMRIYTEEAEVIAQGVLYLSVDGTVLFASWAYTDVYADSQKRRTGSDSACKFCRRFFCQYIF